MGIAFGNIDTEKRYIPEKNALLGITHFNNKPVDSTTYRPGFIMREQSIILGLTADNTASFKCTKLSAGQHQNQKWYWDEVPVSIRINNETWQHGSALIDSGVSNMAFYRPHFSGESLVEKGFKIEQNFPTSVTVKFPDENSNIPEYSFEWSAQEGKEEIGLRRLSLCIEANTMTKYG